LQLKDFVAQSLIQITEGVVEAQSGLVNYGAKVNPALTNLLPKGERNYGAFGWAKGEGSNPVLVVNFDVAVTATEGTKTKGGIGVVVGVISLGSTGATDKENSSLSRLQFQVPLLLPLQPAKDSV
jgi:hypothetical protein